MKSFEISTSVKIQIGVFLIMALKIQIGGYQYLGVMYIFSGYLEYKHTVYFKTISGT
jgi:hypothetical protein